MFFYIPECENGSLNGHTNSNQARDSVSVPVCTHHQSDFHYWMEVSFIGTYSKMLLKTWFLITKLM